jgi:ArsR family transcriptional regulator
MDAQVLKLAAQQADICRIFGNVTRILILWALDNKEMSGEIARAIDTSLQNASQHLRLMKDRGILASRRDGHRIYYRIQVNELTTGCRVLQHAIQYTHSKTRESMHKNQEDFQ